MWKAMKLTMENVAQLVDITEPLWYKSILLELKYNIEDGVETYATMQDYLGMREGDKPNVYLFTADEFLRSYTFKYGNPIPNEFCDVYHNDPRSRKNKD